MFCPKCGKNQDEEDALFCTNCGMDFSTLSKKEEQPDIVEQKPEITVSESVPGSSINIMKAVYLGLAAVVLVMFFMAAESIADGGSRIKMIESVGGKTLEEAYYYQLGSIYAGYAMISRALGIFFAAVLVWLGISHKS